MFKLSTKSKKYIYESTGMTTEQIINMDFEEIDKKISQKVGHKIKDYINCESLIGRGQVYAETKRFLKMEDVDKGLRKHDKRKSRFIKRTVSTL